MEKSSHLVQLITFLNPHEYKKLNNVNLNNSITKVGLSLIISNNNPYLFLIKVVYLSYKNKLKDCIIIDDDKNTVETIKNTLTEFSEFIFAGVFKNQGNALNQALKSTPDIIFLNIDNTNNLLEFLFEIYKYCNTFPVFIAISSSKDKAYDAYKYDFFDYLLTPLTELSLRKCILKYKKKYPPEVYKTLCLKSYKDYQYLNTNEILYLKADNNTTDFHMSNGSIVGAFKTLKTFENTLPANFLRIHKSYIINSDYISRIHYGKSLCIIKNNSKKIPFTKTFIDNINYINTKLLSNTLFALN